MAVPMANDPPFATLNHFAADLGIPSESDLLRIGITGVANEPSARARFAKNSCNGRLTFCPLAADPRRHVQPLWINCDAQAGSRTVNTEPLFSSLATVTSPPIRHASLRVMASPRPVP